jgi:hypothetical protein
MKKIIDMIIGQWSRKPELNGYPDSDAPLESRASDGIEELSKQKDRQYFAEFITSLEERLDVNSFLYQDIKLWPIIRWNLARDIKGDGKSEATFSAPKAEDGAAFTGGKNERSNFIREHNKKSRIENPDPERFVESQKARLRDLGECDYLVFSKYEKYYQPIGDKFYAPIVDPVFEDLSRRGRCAMIGLEPLHFDCVNEPFRVDIEPYMRRENKPPQPFAQEAARIEIEVNAAAEALGADFRLDVNLVINRLERHRKRTELFADILSITKPKAVFFSSFVGWTPLTLAAKRAGVVSVDIQHGGQSAYHYHTTHWTDVPEDGYELLPDLFWVWGSAIKDYIDPWLPGASIRHRAVVGGHRYVAKWKADKTSALHVPCPDLEERIGKATKTVVVTLGYSVEEIIPPYLEKAIAARPDWLWLLRMHPINRGESAVSEIQHKINRSSLQNCEYKYSTTLPLYQIFANADAHVTPFSTTSREAHEFGIPSVIIHPIGKTYFADEIGAGLFMYAESTEKIIESLEAGDQSVKGMKFIETDEFLVDKVLEEVESIRAMIQPTRIFNI